jgi:hypothetical protein
MGREVCCLSGQLRALAKRDQVERIGHHFGAEAPDLTPRGGDAGLFEGAERGELLLASNTPCEPSEWIAAGDAFTDSATKPSSRTADKLKRTTERVERRGANPW